MIDDSDAPDAATLIAENIRLRARVEVLEQELAATILRETPPQVEVVKMRTSVPSQMANEASRLVRAFSSAFAEQLRATADVISSVADEVWRRNDVQPEVVRERTVWQSTPGGATYVKVETTRETNTRAGRVANDVGAVVSTAIERSLDAPQRVIDAFTNAYRS
jgi:hypothetical protein